MTCRLDIDVPLRPVTPRPPLRLPERFWAVRVDPDGNFGIIVGPFETDHIAETEAIRLRDTATPDARAACLYGWCEGALGILQADDVHPVI